MRADAENRSSGRGRNSVRISSQAKFADVRWGLRWCGELTIGGVHLGHESHARRMWNSESSVDV